MEETRLRQQRNDRNPSKSRAQSAVGDGYSSRGGADQLTAGSLTALQNAIHPASSENVVQPGQPVPDFALTDQAGKTIHLSDLRGKVVVLTFGYSRCPFPQYCFRLSNNLAVVEKRFSSRTSRDLVLITVAIDPEHDQGKVLSDYAADRADDHGVRVLQVVEAQVAGKAQDGALGVVGEQEQARGPNFSNLDSSVLKDFSFTKSVRLQFRAEAFDTTNTPPFAQPTSQLNFTTTKFSSITSTKSSNENFGARTLQLALKLFCQSGP